MSAVTAKTKRDDLLREIFGALGQWSELERNVFARAHYHGQSSKVISRSLKLDVKEVNTILRQCDRRLYASLREFRKGSCNKHSHIRAETAEMAARGHDLKSSHELPSKGYKNPQTSQIAI